MYKVGKGTRIYEPVTILKEGREINIGKNCRIGQFCFIAARKFTMQDEAELCPQVTISGGGNVFIGERATICYGARIIPATFSPKGHFMNDPVYQREPEITKVIQGSIHISSGAYIGSNTVICISEENPNILIGDFAVIGALSYIDRDVPANTIIHSHQTLHMKERRKRDEV